MTSLHGITKLLVTTRQKSNEKNKTGQSVLLYALVTYDVWSMGGVTVQCNKSKILEQDQVSTQ